MHNITIVGATRMCQCCCDCLVISSFALVLVVGVMCVCLFVCFWMVDSNIETFVVDGTQQ